MRLMGREIGVKLCHWAIRKKGLGMTVRMKAAKDGNPGKGTNSSGNPDC